jgi:hypothetical protein
MNQLFYHLIYNEKTKRWLKMLEQFEESQTVTGKDLATKLSCTQRTIQSDIKQIKQYFDSSILLLGGEDGYHFFFQSPTAYTRKKQVLLDQEPLFSYADQLLAGFRRTNQEWAETLSLSPARFGRIKRYFVHLLEDQYQLTIVEKNNQLQGSEPAIRQFMYDLYFMLPLCPNVLEKRIESWDSYDQSTKSGQWSLDPIRLNQWKQLAQWRIAQGHFLYCKEGQEDMQEQLADALDQTVTLSVPPREKAALFLLSLKEEQFLNLLRQKEFIRQFSSKSDHHFSMINFDNVTGPFFETLIALMNQFFQISPDKTRKNFIKEQSEEKNFLNQLMKNYCESKKRFERALVLRFQLVGSPALQRWIKNMVRHHLQSKGYYLLEDTETTIFNRQITISNRKTLQDNPRMVGLSTIPEEKEIKHALKMIDW